MHPVLSKTFGGLNSRYYFRQFVFGLIFPVMVYFASTSGNHPFPLKLIPFFIICTLLYPYARFVYESIVSFIMGDNVFYVNAILMLAVKVIMMSVCWSLSPVIAPIGLLYLYFHHSRSERAR
ncbi:hypothetical protein HNO82_12385 [Herbaspirillum sp. C9C3]|nr:hypothetical protein [Herbaspirillum sp. C9C3]